MTAPKSPIEELREKAQDALFTGAVVMVSAVPLSIAEKEVEKLERKLEQAREALDRIFKNDAIEDMKAIAIDAIYALGGEEADTKQATNLTNG